MGGRRKRITTFRFRAQPTPVQTGTLLAWQDAQRALWNAGHAQRMERLKRKGYDPKHDKRWLSAYDQHLELTECRRAFDWLRETPQMVQQDLLTQLDRAWKRFFAKEMGLPRFKSKRRGDWAPLGLPARECKRLGRNRVRVPKLGDLRLRGHRGLRGRPTRVAITRDVDQWFVSITCEIQEVQPQAPAGAIGLDLGVANILADSDGSIVDNPRALDVMAGRLRRAQRVMARRKPKRGQPASANYRKAAHRVAVLHRKIRRQRADLLHNLSDRYAKSHGTVVVEDLQVQSMTKSARGTAEAPGRQVRAKSGLNRSILGVGWHELRRQLAYKCDREGGTLVVVDPRRTSQACSACGHVDARNRRSQAEFVCLECGYRKHADVNAAMNILARGLGRAGAPPAQACRGDVVGRPMKQEGRRASASVSSPVLQGGVR